MKTHKKIALVGTPNAGKSVLFNKITRSNQRVANYSGVTIDSAEADFHFDSELAVLIDLPGAYSLRPYTDDEVVLTEMLKTQSFDGMCIVIDATQLERGVRFAMEVLDSTTAPAVVALNMIDLAKARGFEIDVDALSKQLGVKVIPTVAVKSKGIPELLGALKSALPRERGKFLLGVDAQGSSSQSTPKSVAHQILGFYKKADLILREVLKKPGTEDVRSQRIDKWVLHPVFGWLILIAVLGITFQLMFNFAEYPVSLLERATAFISDQVKAMAFLPELLRDFLTDGVIAGVGGTIVFLPQILILFLLILFLEDFGFMARAVFMLDHLMGKVGLHGRAFLPLLSSYACAIPGIMSTKAIESKKDRMVTIMMIPMMTCSARIPVYTLLISAFIPNKELFLGIKLQGLVMLGLYVAGTGFGLLAGAFWKTFFFKGQRPPLLIELPSYKWPSMSSLGRGLWYRAKQFCYRVGTIILGLTVIIWFCVSFPKAPEGATNPIEYSYAAKVGHAIEPVVRPIGFDWRISMALVPGFAAREVMVAALNTAYAVEKNGNEDDTSKLSEILHKEWSLATALSLLVWYIFAPQCISTIAVARRELQSWKWTGVMVLYLTVLAYFFSFLTYQIAIRL